MLLVSFPSTVEAQTWAPPQTVFVPRTGHTVDGLFLDVWRGSRELLGDPVTEEVRRSADPVAGVVEDRVVQYFENAALAYLPGEPAGEQVRTIDLGRRSLEEALRQRPSAALITADRRTTCEVGSGCRGFRSTGQTLGDEFRSFWELAGKERMLGMPLTEAFRGPDGTWIQYFERVALRARTGDGVEALPLGAGAARREQIATDRVRRPIRVPIYAESLFVEPPASAPIVGRPDLAIDPTMLLDEEALPEEAPLPVEGIEPLPDEVIEPLPEEVFDPAPVAVVGPGPQQGGYQEIVISISAQMLWAYEGNQLVNSTLVSTGTAEVPETTTPIGNHTILSKIDVQTMEGTISDEYYRVEDVPNVMYFDNLGNALHGAYWHNNFGAPMSHGCVNLPLDVAAWMFGWASVGTPVTVIP